MKKPLAVLAAVASSAALAAPAVAATKTVTVGDNYFVRRGTPPTITVTRGTTVKWIWRGSAPHNVVATRGPVLFRSSVKSSGSYSRRMTRAGTYRIVCTIHSGMRMTLRVR